MIQRSEKHSLFTREREGVERGGREKKIGRKSTQTFGNISFDPGSTWRMNQLFGTIVKNLMIKDCGSV